MEASIKLSTDGISNVDNEPSLFLMPEDIINGNEVQIDASLSYGKNEDQKKTAIFDSLTANALHSQVQELRDRSEKPLIDPKILEAKENEKQRLQTLKDQILSRKATTTEEIISSSILHKEKLNRLEMIGLISPTKGFVIKDIDVSKDQSIQTDTDLSLTMEAMIDASMIPTDISIEELLIADVYLDVLEDEISSNNYISIQNEVTQEQALDTIERTLTLLDIPDKDDNDSTKEMLIESESTLSVFS
jgi:hypothetical protein